MSLSFYTASPISFELDYVIFIICTRVYEIAVNADNQLLPPVSIYIDLFKHTTIKGPLVHTSNYPRKALSKILYMSAKSSNHILQFFFLSFSLSLSLFNCKSFKFSCPFLMVVVGKWKVNGKKLQQIRQCKEVAHFAM
jgi:hypothetical protein